MWNQDKSSCDGSNQDKSCKGWSSQVNSYQPKTSQVRARQTMTGQVKSEQVKSSQSSPTGQSIQVKSIWNISCQVGWIKSGVILDPKIFQKFLLNKYFLDKKLFLDQIFFGPNMFWTYDFGDQKVLLNKNCRSNIFLAWNLFGPNLKMFFDPKSVWPTYFRPKIFIQFLLFWNNIFGPRTFFQSTFFFYKNSVRLKAFF